MDPNLTLAHTTHNTAVILLHQGIAYPPLHWKSSPVKLPSASSAEACLDAASEISNLGRQFLSCSPILTNPQFSFCLFIAGRMLLTHSKYYGTPIPPELDALIASLFEISRRWAGPPSAQDIQKDNLASGFAKRLLQARDNFSALPRPSLDIRQTAYSENTEDRSLVKPGETMHTPMMQQPRSDGLIGDLYVESEMPLLIPDNHSDTSVGLAFPPLPLSFHQALQHFADVDPFNIPLTERDQLSSQNVTVSMAPQEHLPMWNGGSAGVYNTRTPAAFNNASPRSVVSPEQRINRYGVTEAAP